MAATADLHILSRYSDRSPEWLFRRFAFPASNTPPDEIYQRCREKGMTFVTITDHDRIEGCLEIAGRPGTFLSECVTAHFPGERAKVQILTWGITEAQHREMQPLRRNIFELQGYLFASGIAHAVAHPLYRLGDEFSRAHFEKLLLLFRHFEGLNGLRDALFSETAQFILRRLTKEKIEELSERHGIAPTHPEPWRKVLTAGSDDHGGLFAASAFTETPDVATPAAFLEQIREGRCEIRGKGGAPLALSHTLYKTVYTYARERLGRKDASGFIEKAFSRFMEGKDPTEFSLTEKLGFLAQGVLSGKVFELANPANVPVWRQFAQYFKETDFKTLVARETRGIEEPERRAFVIANLLANQLAFRFFDRFVKDLSAGKVIESLQDVSTLAPILLTLTPYIYSFQSQAPCRKWLSELAVATTGDVPDLLRNTKRAWFTDTLEDVNGVATTIRKMAGSALTAGKELIVVTSRSEIQIHDIPIKNFAPIGEFELPEYQLQKLSFPPILQMIDYIQRERFTEIIISTPGPIGITALLAAKMLRLPACGIYHTDFPQYVRILTDDSFLETLTWNYMKWFYSQLDLIYVNSETYREAWVERGIDRSKIAILPRGLDTFLFHPSHRDQAFRQRYGISSDKVVLLYVGRISKEKDLDVLLASYRQINGSRPPVHFVLVGDGPYLAELKGQMPEASFTGYLTGEALAQAYAAADVFLFPSTTDTFGNVVLEAMASGLPNVVSNSGGPKELVQEGVTGFVTRSLDAEDFTRAIRQLVNDPELRGRMSLNARRAVEHRDWSEAFARFWALSDV